MLIIVYRAYEQVTKSVSLCVVCYEAYITKGVVLAMADRNRGLSIYKRRRSVFSEVFQRSGDCWEASHEPLKPSVCLGQETRFADHTPYERRDQMARATGTDAVEQQRWCEDGAWSDWECIWITLVTIGVRV